MVLNSPAEYPLIDGKEMGDNRQSMRVTRQSSTPWLLTLSNAPFGYVFQGGAQRSARNTLK